MHLVRRRQPILRDRRATGLVLIFQLDATLHPPCRGVLVGREGSPAAAPPATGRRAKMAGLSHHAEPGHQIPYTIGRRWRKPAIDLPRT
jgi:hypothetical protein